jgi:hypothetical protein
MYDERRDSFLDARELHCHFRVALGPLNAILAFNRGAVKGEKSRSL